jgi:hypothetical protein
MVHMISISVADPGCLSRISFHPGSRVQKKAPDPGSGSATKNLSILNPKNGNQTLGNTNRGIYSGSQNPDLDFTHPGSSDQKSTGSRIRKTVFYDPIPAACLQKGTETQ